MTDASPASLEAEYRRRKREIREDPALGWEAKEKRIKLLGDQHHARLEELEREAGAA